MKRVVQERQPFVFDISICIMEPLLWLKVHPKVHIFIELCWTWQNHLEWFFFFNLAWATLMTKTNQLRALDYFMVKDLKDGTFMQSKYKYDSCMKCFASPHTVLFSNYHLNYEKMSRDRWVVYEIDSVTCSASLYIWPDQVNMWGSLSGLLLIQLK